MSLQVWIINHYALAPDQPGGTRHYNLAHYLSEKDIEATIIASSRNYLTQIEQRLESGEKSKIIIEKGVRYVWIAAPKYKGNGIGRIKNMLNFMQHALNWQTPNSFKKPDIILGSSPHLFSGLTAYFLAKRYKIPFILEIRDIWPKSLVELMGISGYHPFILLLSKIEKFLYRKSDLVVGVLQGVGEHAKRVVNHSVPFIWLPNGVNLEDHPIPKAAETQRHIFSVLYTGAHGIPNSLDTAIEAAKLLQAEKQPIQFTFVGEGVSKLGLIERARHLKLENVSFKSAVAKPEIPNLLAQADALLLLWRDSPLYQDGISPNKLFDYFAAAKPIIHAIRSPFDPVREAGAGLSIPPEDPRALADALIKLSHLPAEERRAMGTRGRAYVEEHHDMRRLAHKLGQVLWTLASANAASRQNRRR